MGFEPMEECIFYQNKPRCCKALNHLYCQTEECAFYKSRNEYEADGKKKKETTVSAVIQEYGRNGKVKE